MCHGNRPESPLQDPGPHQVSDILKALDPLVDVVRELVRENAMLLASERISARRLAILEAQFDQLQRRDEELLFRKFVARYYSEQLFAVRCQYEAEIGRFQAFQRVLKDLTCFLPDAERDRALRLLATRAGKPRGRRAPAGKRRGNPKLPNVEA